MSPDPTTARATPIAPSRPGPPWDVAAWALVFLAVAALLQILTPVPWDADTAYHVAVARLIARHGILHAFPWTPFSWLAENYADKELLFHLLMVPLAGLSWIAAAKITGAVLGGALLLVLYLVLRAEGVPHRGLWALLPLAASASFLLRFALVRPHLLGVALAIAGAWAVNRRRLWLLAAVSLLFPWCYVAWHTPLVLAAIAAVAQLLSGERPSWKPAAAAAAGLGLGLVVHPNFPNLARFAWVVNVEILMKTAWAGRAGFALGPEFQPFTLAEALRFLTLPLGLAAAALLVAWRRRREDPGSLGLALTAAAYAAMTVRSGRFIEYLAPVSVLAFAVAIRPLRWSRRAAPIALVGATALTAALGAPSLDWLAIRQDELPPPMAALLRKAIPEGAQVFTCDWGFTGELLLALPERRFMVALDPTLFFLEDPQLYALWFALPREGPADAADAIRRRFGARYVLCAAFEESMPLFRSLERDGSVRQVLRSPLWFFADLGDPGTNPR
ncbi:MAG TPA: hypothetical protein VIV57_23015 [Anaeromyxobacter sp.]